MTEAASGQLPRSARNPLVSVVAGLVITGGILIGLTFSGDTSSSQAPAFSLPRLGGGTPVAYPLRGPGPRPSVVLTFFASWCGPCRRELPTIARVAARRQAGPVSVVFLGIDGNDDPSSGLSFARQSGVRFAVGADADSRVAPTFGLIGYPGTVFIDSSGRVVDTVRGPVTLSTLETWTARLSRG